MCKSLGFVPITEGGKGRGSWKGRGGEGGADQEALSRQMLCRSKGPEAEGAWHIEAAARAPGCLKKKDCGGDSTESMTQTFPHGDRSSWSV